jgi:type IV pilus assembly protein PilM
MAHRAQHSLLTYFPVPKFLEMPSVGIDISASAVRFLEIYPSDDCMVVGKYDSLELKQEVDFSENILKNEELRAILTSWKKKYKLSFVEASLPEEKAYLFQIDVPEGGDREMRDSIEFRLEENAPLSAAEAVFDFKIFGKSQKAGMQSAMVTVVPEKIAAAYTELLNSCGLTPVSFLMEAQALSKAIVPAGSDSTFFVIHMMKRKSVLFIIKNSTVRFSSSIALGSDTLTDALMKSLGKDREEARTIKRTQGFLKSKDNVALDILTAALQPLRDEIERIWIYWHTRKDEQASDIQEVLLSGKDTHIPGIKEYLSESLRVPISRANVWSNMCSFDEYVPIIPKEQASEFGVAIGLALPKL